MSESVANTRIGGKVLFGCCPTMLVVGFRKSQARGECLYETPNSPKSTLIYHSCVLRMLFENAIEQEILSILANAYSGVIGRANDFREIALGIAMNDE